MSVSSAEQALYDLREYLELRIIDDQYYANGASSVSERDNWLVAMRTSKDLKDKVNEQIKSLT